MSSDSDLTDGIDGIPWSKDWPKPNISPNVPLRHRRQALLIHKHINLQPMIDGTRRKVTREALRNDKTLHTGVGKNSGTPIIHSREGILPRASRKGKGESPLRQYGAEKLGFTEAEFKFLCEPSSPNPWERREPRKSRSGVSVKHEVKTEENETPRSQTENIESYVGGGEGNSNALAVNSFSAFMAEVTAHRHQPNQFGSTVGSNNYSSNAAVTGSGASFNYELQAEENEMPLYQVNQFDSTVGGETYRSSSPVINPFSTSMAGVDGAYDFGALAFDTPTVNLHSNPESFYPNPEVRFLPSSGLTPCTQPSTTTRTAATTMSRIPPAANARQRQV